MPTTIHDLPWELLEVILSLAASYSYGSYTTGRPVELLSFALVHRDWTPHALSQLYICVKLHSQRSVDRFKAHSARRDYRTKELWLGFGVAIFEGLLGECEDLEKLVLQNAAPVSSRILTLPSLSKLDSLVLSSATCMWCDSMIDPSAIKVDLKHLAFEDFALIRTEPQALQYLVTASTSLTHLDLTESVFQDHAVAEAHVLRLLPIMPNLKKLALPVISNTTSEWVQPAFETLLQGASVLRHLTLTYDLDRASVIANRFSQTVLSISSGLQHLHLSLRKSLRSPFSGNDETPTIVTTILELSQQAVFEDLESLVIESCDPQIASNVIWKKFLHNEYWTKMNVKVVIKVVPK